jgi:hypothetical protein
MVAFHGFFMDLFRGKKNMNWKIMGKSMTKIGNQLAMISVSLGLVGFGLVEFSKLRKAVCFWGVVLVQ